ncbi:MAG: HEAT repeat domain-containing protein, partial [Planctomycetota bacterium]
AINTIALLNPGISDDPDAANSVLTKALDVLDAFYSKKLGRGEQLIQSHVPPAVGKLLGRGNDERRKAYKELYHRELTGRKRRSNDVYRSAAIALGQLVQPLEVEAKDAKYSTALLDYFRDGRDHQARYFALMALGQIGGAANRGNLLTVLRRGRKALERPWAALALGVYCFNIFEGDESAPVDGTVGEVLLKQFKDVRTPQARGAFAIALGLARYREAAGEMLKAMVDKKHQDDLAGFLSLGLALMDYKPAKADIHEILQSAVRRPGLLKQAAIALGKLGDRAVTETLTRMLSESTNLAKLSAIAGAMNFIGDRRTIKPLVRMLFDDDLTDLTRAFAAVALGGVADKEKLPWNSKIARKMNYRASVETLTQSGRGILDIF